MRLADSEVKPETLRARELADQRRREALRVAILSGDNTVRVRVHELAALLGVSRVTVWTWARKGLLPKATEIGGTRGWSGLVVRDLLAGRKAA